MKKLDEFSQEELTGKLSDVVAKLQKILDKYPNATIETNIDWGGCYYEGDTPDYRFIIRNT